MSLWIAAIFLIGPAPRAQGWEWALEGGRSGRGDLNSASDIAVDSDGYIYVTGSFSGRYTLGTHTLRSAGQNDAYIAKLSPDRSVVWIRQVGGSGFDGAGKVEVGHDGYVYITGYFNDSITISSTRIPSAGSADLFLFKYDKDGSMIWTRQAGGTSMEEVNDMNIDSRGSIYLIGNSAHSPAFGHITLQSRLGQNAFVVKYTFDGSVAWARWVSVSGDCNGRAIDVDDDYNVYVVGSLSGNVRFGAERFTSAGTSDIFLSKLSGDGSLLWTRRAGGDYDDGGMGVIADSAGNVYVSGHFNESSSFGQERVVSAGMSDGFLAKYGPNGEVLWVETMGGEDYDGMGSISIGTDGRIYVATSLGNQAIVVRYVSDGYALSVSSTTSNDYNRIDSIEVIEGAASGINDIYVVGGFSGAVQIGSTRISTPASFSSYIAMTTDSGM